MTVTASRRATVPSQVPALLAALPADADAVVERVARLQEGLDGERGACDGVACFNRLYQRIVHDVRAQLDDAGPVDRDFLARLVVEFAGRYFQALRTDAAGGTPPRSWVLALDRRPRGRVTPEDRAVVGITVHVNLDLAPAVVRACTVLGRSVPGPDERADFRALHDAAVEHTGRLLASGGRGDAVVADVPVLLDREAVWRQAVGLWGQRSRPTEYERELDALDQRTALLGRGLLTPGALR